MFELAKQFRFEAAHSLMRTIDAEASRRIHGHSYRAEVVVRGTPDPETGMIVDLSELERRIGEARSDLDHHFLDDLADLGPPTLENLAAWVWRRLEPGCPDLVRVAIHRDSSGDSCTFFGA